jgi:hypothetical protein
MADDAGRDFRDLLELLGQLLFHWCRLEETFDGALRRLHDPRSAGATLPPAAPLGERLAHWRRASHVALPDRTDEIALLAREIERLRRIRNLVTHHLVEVSGLPGETAFIRCRKKRRGQMTDIRIGSTELEAAVDAIDACRGRLHMLVPLTA